MSILILGLVFSLIAQPSAWGIGYVVTAKDRAEADALYQQAYAAYQTGDYPQTITLTEQADRRKPDQPDGWNLRGMALLKQKNYPQANAAFSRAVALDPKLWAAQFNLAESLFQQKDYVAARTRFERLLAQTDRFKEKNKWELVQYKAIVCCVVTGDTAAAGRKLAKLPVSGGATPAHQYAEAALSYQAKKSVLAQKSVSDARAAFPVEINDLFSSSLVQAGWQSPPPAAFLASTGVYTPGSAASLPYSGPNGRMSYVVDPKLAAMNDPLPVPDGGISFPMLSKIPPPLRGPAVPTLSGLPKPPSSPTASELVPISVASTSVSIPAPAPTPLSPDIGLEHGGLLLDE